MTLFGQYLCLAMFFTATTASGMAQCLPPSAGPNALSLTISAVQDAVLAGSPVLVKAVLTNKSNQDLCMLVPIGGMYTANVHDAEGNIPPETKLGFYHDSHVYVGKVAGVTELDMRYLNGNMLSVVHKPNESDVHTVDVSRFYNLDQPGTYTIFLSLAVFPADKSNAVAVTVVPTPAATPATGAQQASVSAPFSLNIRADDSARLGSSVDVYVVTKNVSTQSIVLRRQEHPQDTGMLGSVFRVDISDSLGNSLPETALGESTDQTHQSAPDPAAMASARAAGTLVSLKPGQDWRNTLRVSDLYDLSKPGLYTIQVRRWDDETKTWVKSNTITVTVTQ